MDSGTDFISRIIFRAVDEVSATLKGIAGEMDMVDARVQRVDAEYGAALTRMESYEVRVAALSRDMATASVTPAPQMAVVGNTEQAATQARALAAADTAIATESAKAGSAAEKSAGQIRKQGDAARTTEGSIRKAASALLLIGGILVGAGVASGVMATRFQSDMELVKTQAHASQVEVDRMSQSVLTLAPQVGVGPDKLAEGLYHVESAGFRGAEALRILRAAAEGAKVGHADLESVTQAMVAVEASHIKGIHSEIQAMGILNAIVGAGDMRMQQLADAMSTGVVESAKTFGLSIRDVGAALATLGDNLMQGSEAGTRLRMTLALMAAPSRTAADALATIGLKATTLADDMRKPQGLLVALEDLKKHLQDSGKTPSEQADVLSKAFGGGKSSGVLLTLLDQMDRLKQKYGDVAAGAKKFGEDWAATQKQAKQQADELKAGVEVLAIQVGSVLVPAFKSLVTSMLPAVKAGADWARQHQQAVEVALALGAGLLALGLAMKAYLLVANLAKAASIAWTAAQWLLNAALDANPIGLVIIAVAALVAAFVLAYTHSARFREITQSVLSTLKDLAQAIETKVIGTFNLMRDAAEQIGHKLDGLANMLHISKGDFLLLIPAIGPVIFAFEHLGQVVHKTGDILGALGTRLGEFFSATAKMISGIPVLGGLFSGLGNVLIQVAKAFGQVGAGIDAYAASTPKATTAASQFTAKQKELIAASNQTASAIQKTSSHIEATGAKHTSVTTKMVAEAGRVESAWDRIGKKIAAVALTLAAVTLSGAHAEGAAAASQYRQQFQQAAHVHVHAPTVTLAGQRANQQISYQNFRDQDQARAAATGNNAQVLYNAGAGGGVAGLDKSIAQFAASVDKLPPSLQGAMSSVIQQYRAQIDALEKQAANQLRAEDQRHIAALQAIQQKHEAAINGAQQHANQQMAALNASHQAALKNHSASVQASLQAHTQHLNQTVAQHVAGIKQDNADHQAKLKAIHDAYVQKLDSIHGKNASQRRAAAADAYVRQIAAANTAYAKKIAADEKAITNAKKAYDEWLAKNKGANDRYIAAQTAAYQRHVAAIQQTLNTHVSKANQAAAAAQAKEDALHTKHVAAIKAAFGGHVAGLKKALKEASSPTGLVNALSTQLQTNYDTALNKVTLDYLEHGKATKKDIDALQQAAAQQKQLTDAQWLAAFTAGDLATKQQMLSQLFSTMVSRTQSIMQMQQSEQQGQSQIQGDVAAQQLDKLKAIETAITSQTAVMQAEAGVRQAAEQVQITATNNEISILQAQSAVDQATANAVITAIKDQTSVFQARQAVTEAGLNGQLTALKDTGAILQAQGEIAQATTDAARKVAEDHLRIAQETYAMDQRQAAFEVVIARDNLKIAQDTLAQNKSQAQWDIAIAQAQLQAAKDTAAMNRSQAQWDQKIASDQLLIAQHQAQAAAAAASWTQRIDDLKIQVDQANLALTKAQNKLTYDQLTVLTDISTLLQSAVGAQIADYGQMLSSDLQGIQTAQDQLNAITTSYTQAQQQAAAVAQSYAIQAAQEQQKLATDQVAKAEDATHWQQVLADDQKSIAEDQAAKADDNLTWQQKLAQDQQQLALDTAAKSQSSIEDQAKVQQDQNQEIIDQIQANTAAVQAGNTADAGYYQRMIAMQDQIITAYRTGAIRPMNPKLTGRAQQDSFTVDAHGSVLP